MKKKAFIFTLLAVIFTFSANAQLFWKVSGNGLSKPSYLFGTHHLIEKEKIIGFDKVLSVIPQTDAVVGEIEMRNMLGMQLKMLKVAFMKDTTMHDLLSARDYILVDSVMKKVVGKGLDKLGRMKPNMLGALYEVKLYMNQNNVKKEPEAIDIVFQKKGKKAKKKIIGLETIDQQINIFFNSMSLKSQAESLVEAVKNNDKSLIQLKQLTEAYLNGDLKKLTELNNQDGHMTPEEKKVLIVDRNRNWVVQLKTLMQKQSCFVAVGCLHLVDEDGLIQQLKDVGYTVEAVEDLH